jgi:hypothetical protein
MAKVYRQFAEMGNLPVINDGLGQPVLATAIIDENGEIVSTTAINKIDALAVNGLSGVADSLAYKVDEIEHHLHNSEQIYGSNSGFMTSDFLTKFTVVGGNNAYGTELHIYAGDTIASGSAVQKLDINSLYVIGVSAANKLSVVEFLSSTAGADIASVTLTDVGDLFTKVGHGLVNGDKVIVTTVTTTTGLSTTIVYYVISVAGNDFQLSLTSGGAAVVLGGGNGSATLKKLTQTSMTKCLVSKAATTASSDPFRLLCPRIACDKHISVRAKSETGSTISIDFLLGLHTYTA